MAHPWVDMGCRSMRRWGVSARRHPAIFPRRPSAAELAAFLANQATADFGYRERGATQSNDARPAGYDVDHNRMRLGTGDAAFAAACAALRAWRMFPGPWTCIAPDHAPLRVGQTLAMQARAFGLWWVNGCRIVYVIEESTPVRRFGFAYGTLGAHVEQGEERFSVELHADGAVWYDLRAFSRPRFWLVRLAKPLARRLQRRFVLESQRAMRAAVDGGSG